jgi:Holliday junction DNA helicase RuvA
VIAKLTGLFDSSGRDWLVIDVSGVGYMVYVSGRTLSNLPLEGQKFSLLIETIIRNEQPQLCGFLDEIDRKWFRLLIGVQGVGAKVALAILSALSPEEIGNAILFQDKTLISRAEGVGPKLATRIVSELKDKTIGMDNLQAFQNVTNASAQSSIQEAISVLINLGYARHEAAKAVALIAAELGEQTDTETLIRHSLKNLGQVNNG